MKLIGDGACLQGAQLVAEFVGVPISVAPASQSQNSADCLADCKPTLETPFGVLHGCETCCRYFSRIRPEKGLQGRTPFEMCQVDSWVEFSRTKLGCCPESLKKVDDHLRDHTYLVGETITLADLYMMCKLSKTPEKLSGLCHLNRWYNTIMGQKAVKKVLEGGQQKGGKQQQKQTPKKTEEKKTDDADEEQAPKPTKCILDDLPASPFVLDAWKREYSNSKDLYGQAMKYFWEKYDPAGYSLWYMRYEKLADECTVSYVTSNQLGGFLQRTDPNFRKYAFGNCNVMGKDKDFNIEGVWLFRGTEMPPQMQDHPSYEYHKWRKLDHTKDEDKKLVADFWCADDAIGETLIADSKIYK